MHGLRVIGDSIYGSTFLMIRIMVDSAISSSFKKFKIAFITLPSIAMFLNTSLLSLSWVLITIVGF